MSQACFQINQFSSEALPRIRFVKSENEHEISLSRPQHHH